MSNTTPIELLSSLRVGTVEFVSPDELKILLDTEAPDNTALNTGKPRPFPRVNGYLLIPVDLGFVVGQITWITIERSNFPVRTGFKDFGLVDLPFPLRKVNLHPVGTLSRKEDTFKFSRGIENFPSVGDVVLLPTDEQLKTIIESGNDRRVHIGNSVLVDSAQIKIDPDKLFGRHLAVLGNTGSGKSCSVAGLIRWSIESAIKENKSEAQLNGRFIILDPNGEYGKAFNDLPCAKVYSIEVDEKKQLQVPLWMWNTEEWCGFTKATAKTQRPTLIHALKCMRAGTDFLMDNEVQSFVSFIRTLISALKIFISAGDPWGVFPKPKIFYETLCIWNQSIPSSDTFSDELKNAISQLQTSLNGLIAKYSSEKYPKYLYERQEIINLLNDMVQAYHTGGGKDSDLLPVNPDCPTYFNGDDFINAIQASSEILHTSDFVDSIINQIKTLITDVKLKTVVSDEEGSNTLDNWLEKYIGGSNACSVTILDLSLLPNHVVHTITAVVSRMVFEALQRYRRLNNKCLPTVLVVEEAHYFIKKYSDEIDNMGADALCCKVCEKIAREGRKFGLGMVISSQRPSELSPTVLSQCNSFLIHRISNDRDQELISRLLQDNMRGMLRELPSLPSHNAILLGWASELPILIRMKYLPKDYRPQSDDPDFWNVWTNVEDREVNWQDIARDWQNSK